MAWGTGSKAQDEGTALAKKLNAAAATGWQQDYGGSQQKAYDEQQAWNSAHPDMFMGVVGSPTPNATPGAAAPPPPPSGPAGSVGLSVAGPAASGVSGDAGSGLGGTPPEMPATSSLGLQGLRSAAAGNAGPGMMQESNPTGLRPGLGTRIMPQYSAALAGLRSAY